MPLHDHQNLILIEGAATYERILADIREVDTEDGIRHILDFLKIFPEFAKAHNDLAVMYYQSGNTLKCLAHYEKAHKLDPGNVIYRKNLADFYFVELEWTGEAIHTYLEILKDNPFDTEALNALGTISQQLGRNEQARKYFSRTLQLDTGNMDARQAMQQLVPKPSLPETQSCSEKAPTACIEQKPTSRPEGGTTFLNRSISPIFQPEPVQSKEELYREALALVNSDKLSEAMGLLEVILSMDVANAAAHNDLGVLCQKTGEMQKALLHHKEAVRLQPANDIFQKNLADLLCSEFDAMEEALGIYVKLYERNLYDVEIIRAIAFICIETGNKDDACFFLNQILAVKPWDREAGEALRAIRESGC